MSHHLSAEQLVRELQRRPGLIPVEIDLSRQRAVWLDLNGYHCYEGFFHRSLQILSALRRVQGQPEEMVTSDLSALQSEQVLTDHLYPTGFIFHAGRCGSTLLTKALARARAHLVFGEAAPLNQIWAVLTDGWRRAARWNEEQQALFKHLILAMGRRRRAEHRAYFLKFTSFNLLFCDFIRRVFPDVPALFLYREPRETLSSMLNNPPGWMRSPEVRLRAVIAGASVADVQHCETRAYAERALTNFFAAALRAGAGGLRYLNYEQLTADRLPLILQAFQTEVTPEELRALQDQFCYYAKSDYGARAFPTPVRRQGVAAEDGVSGELTGLYQALARSPFNLFSA
jgi:hypothetical protein